MAVSRKPWDVVKRGNDWCVIKTDTEEVIPGGCHPSEGAARNHLRGVAAGMHAESKAHEWWISHDDMRKLCPICARNMKAKGVTRINLTGVKQMPSELLNALCDRMGDSFTRCMSMSFGDFDPSDKESFCAWLHHECTGEWPGEARAINKAANPRLMLVVASNAYRDREDEIIRERALKAYVESCWKGGQFTGTNPLLLWHGGDPIGDIVWADMIGPFLLEVHQERPDGPVNLALPGEPPVVSTVKAVWDALETQGEENGASHEFGYIGPDREDGIYELIAKIETSILPRDMAANGFTLAQVLRSIP